MSHPYPSRPIRVLHLSGTPYEVGRQHAEAVGEEIVQGMAGFYSSFWNRMMNPELAGARKLIFSIVGKLIDPLLIGRLAGQLPETARALIAGLSGGDDRRYRELVRSTVLPDMMPILLSMSAQLRPLSVIPASDPPLFGCSSFFAKGDSLLRGRNLDFPGVAYMRRS
ncbi:MAG: hypothetical protein HYR96_02610 [Deltaproteobacteria bacterium]|nr:hypothetical protein [Deltaproteobacteria bacterium]